MGDGDSVCICRRVGIASRTIQARLDVLLLGLLGLIASHSLGMLFCGLRAED